MADEVKTDGTFARGLPGTGFSVMLTDVVDGLFDPEGVELPDLETARKRAVEPALRILAADLQNGAVNLNKRIEIRDEDGSVICAVRFRDLVPD